MATISLPNLVLRKRTWFARMLVPADVQPILGKSVLIQTTGERDPHRAAIVAKPIVEGWKRSIAQARSGTYAPVSDAVLDLAAAYRRAKGDQQDVVLEDAIDWVAKRLAGTDLLGLTQRAATQTRGDLYEAFSGLPGGREAQKALDVVTGDRTPFLVRADAWADTLKVTMKSEQNRRAYVRDVKAFGEWLQGQGKDSLEDVTLALVTSYLRDQTITAKVSPNTLKGRMAAVKAYWAHLQADGLVALERNPLRDAKAPRRAVDETVKRRPFTPEDVAKLVRAARDAGDHTLAALILLAAGTGARIRELCNLRLEDVTADFVNVVDSKTQAGVRSIPVTRVTELGMREALADRIRRGRPDKFILSGLSSGEMDDRSKSIGVRFSKLKDRLGYGEDVVFHSLRKMVTTLLEQSGASENVAADILGHEKPRITYGLYSSGSGFVAMTEALSKALRPVEEALKA